MVVQTLNPESLVARIIAELDETPQARPILLRALLTDDFLALPAKVDEMQEQIVQIQGDIVQMRGDIRQMQGQIGNLQGERYERRMVRNVGHIAWRSFDMRRIKILKGESSQPLLDFIDDADAVIDGSVSDELIYDLLLADIVASGIRWSDRAPVHLVAEVSIAIDANDIRRAAERASTMAAVTGETAIAAVVGERIPDSERRRAERSGVAVTIIRS